MRNQFSRRQALQSTATIAASVFNLRGSQGADLKLVEQIRAALS